MCPMNIRLLLFSAQFRGPFGEIWRAFRQHLCQQDYKTYRDSVAGREVAIFWV